MEVACMELPVQQLLLGWAASQVPPAYLCCSWLPTKLLPADLGCPELLLRRRAELC